MEEVLARHQARSVFHSQPQGSNSSAARQTATDTRPLEPGQLFEREIAGKQVHLYRVKLASRQYLRMAVDQRGVDVVIVLRDPDGKQAA